MNIRELTTDEEFRAAFEVMHELRDHLDESTYMERLAAMRPRGFRVIAGEVSGRIVALAGIGVEMNLYYGRYMWVYDLITTRSERSKGYGLALLRHVEQLAREEDCDALALASALHRNDAHRFYLDKAEMTKRSFTFVKELS